MINTEETENIKGHSLKGMKLILKPVNMETIARTRSSIDEIKYTALDKALKGSIKVTAATSKPMKNSDTPSTIHSIVMIRLLSGLMSPKLSTTDFVGNRISGLFPQKRVTPKPNREKPD